MTDYTEIDILKGMQQIIRLRVARRLKKQQEKEELEKLWKGGKK